jgi:plastocyanin
MLARLILSGMLLMAVPLSPLSAQRVHPVRLVHTASGEFRFEPRRVNANRGDILEFTVQSGGPYVVGFEPADLPGRARDLLDVAIPERTGFLRGPVLAGPGSAFRITIPGLPKGSYRFLGVTHMAYRMEGRLVIR